EYQGYLADMQVTAGELESAVATYQRAVPLREHVFGREHPSTLQVYTNLGCALGLLARADDPVAQDRLAPATARRVLGPDRLGLAMIAEGEAWLALGKPADATALIERGLPIFEAASHDVRKLADNLTALAEAKLALRRPAEALALAERALKLSEGTARYPGRL